MSPAKAPAVPFVDNGRRQVALIAIGKVEAGRGLRAEAGCGFPLFGGRFTVTPTLSLGFSDGGTRATGASAGG